MSRDEIREAEQRLSDLHYWVGRTDGVVDPQFTYALQAFQKVEGRPRTGKLTIDELNAIRSAGTPPPLEGGSAHLEVDLARQVLFLVDDNGAVARILPVSTGSGETFKLEGEVMEAVTPVGRFRVQRKLDGLRKSPLGLLYYPMYIVGGIAIHGNRSVPVRPASHGCIRIPMFAARELNDATPIGKPVIVHVGNREQGTGDRVQKARHALL